MSEERSTWLDARRLADELRRQIHLASMDTRDAWRRLQPRMVRLEHALCPSNDPVGDGVKRELAAVCTALRKLRDELSHACRSAIGQRTL